MLNHYLIFRLWGFLSVDFKLKSLESGLLNNLLRIKTEQPPDNAGAGWLFIAAAFPDGK
jgi:hypothetical protein